jgi:hypothetical protein
MSNPLDALTVRRKTGGEPFQLDGRPTGFTLLNFWQWLASDLVDNALRGALAERHRNLTDQLSL